MQSSFRRITCDAAGTALPAQWRSHRAHAGPVDPRRFRDAEACAAGSDRAVRREGAGMNRRVTLAVVVAAGIVGAVIEWRQPLLPDSSWLLTVAARELDGARLYRDVFDINPPLAIWLDAVVVLVSRGA